MYGLKQFWHSTIGKKIVMAVTGIIGILFVIGHMSGNLLMFSGPEAIHKYAELLRTSMPLLWAVRITLIVSVVLHIMAAVQLTRRAQAARPQAYAMRRPQVTTFAARTIRIGGLIIVLFIIYHIMHMTLGWVHPSFVHLDPYHNLSVGLANPIVAGFYLLAVIALGYHLYHGTWSAFRTLGVSPSSVHPLKRRIALVVAVIVAAGFAVIPIATQAGLFPDAPAIMEDSATQATAGPAVTASATHQENTMAETH